MSWILLLIAGVFEMGWTLFLKYSHGGTYWVPTVFAVISLCASMALLAISVRSIPIGTAYAVWTGLGAVGTAIAGMMLFGESVSIARIASLFLIVAGIIGLKIFAE